MVEQKNPLILAFVGDAMQTLYVRTVLAKTDLPPRELHLRASQIVCARAQAKRFDEIFDGLNDIERRVAMRARNADHNTVPTSCTIAEYHKATALEAVIGYNALVGNHDRIAELIGELNKC